MLKVFETDLRRLGLHESVRATCFGINISILNFYAILELCYLESAYFSHQLAMELHEMWKVSNLPMGSIPYEEYFSCVE